MIKGSNQSSILTDISPKRNKTSLPPPQAQAPKAKTSLSSTKPQRNKKTLLSLNKFKKFEQQGNDRHLSVEKQIVDELLLVCGVIGSTEDPDSQRIVPVEDCLNWLQDLQRALRRDEDAYRPISLLLGQWKIVQQKLLPLVLSCRYDTPLVITIVKILVILTKPMSGNARNAGRLIIDTKSKNVEEAVIEEQIKLRNNAIAQANLLTEYKKLFVYHPSHRKKPSKKHQKKLSTSDPSSGGLLSIFVSLLTEPLSKTGMARSNEDHLTVELILHLFRNLLCAGEPLFKDAENVQESNKLHQELIALFDKELVLDIFLVLGQEMESRENIQYNLLLMEIMHHLLKSQDPTLVAQSVLNDKSTNFNSNTQAKNNPKFPASKRFQRPPSSKSNIGSLRDKLQKERQKLQAANSSRHSHFGGTLVIKKEGGDQQFVAATKEGFQNHSSNLSKVDAKRKTKKHQYFIGSGKPISAYYARTGTHSSTFYTGPASLRAQLVLHRFCSKFLARCYGPVMKSLKDEFRRDSSRLEEEDKITFFRIVWFFCQWRRVAVEEAESNSGSKHRKNDKESTSIGNLVFTMDVFTFNLVLTSLEFYMEHKKFKNLGQAVSLYTEMIRLLYSMRTSSDSMENIMAMGLMDNLFYKQDCLDKLPKLLSKWTPGTFTIDYLCDLMELTHMTLKTLEVNEKACSNAAEKGKKSRKKMGLEQEEPQDRVAMMKEKAAEFDSHVYLARKIISNQSVFMFTQLLSQYTFNAPRINNHIVAFFVRLCKFVVAKDDDFDYSEKETMKDEQKNNVTLEPMLFNIHLLNILNEVLNNDCLRNDKEYCTLISFGSTLVRHYARTCEKNPMLFVETLFRQSIPHRYCESLMNNYVSDELKMISEREVLLEQQYEGYVNDSDENNDDATSDFDNEIEIFGERKNQKQPLASQINAKNNKKDDESSDEEQEMEFDDVKEVVINASTENDANRWSDRRVFVPKRKSDIFESDENINQENESDPLDPEQTVRNNAIHSGAIQDTSESEESNSVKTSSLSAQRINQSPGVEETDPFSSPKLKRIKRAVFDESSDEEEFGDTQITILPSQGESKPNFDDSDEDE